MTQVVRVMILALRIIKLKMEIITIKLLSNYKRRYLKISFYLIDNFDWCVLYRMVYIFITFKT